MYVCSARGGAKPVHARKAFYYWSYAPTPWIFETGSHHVVQAGELMKILLPLPPVLKIQA
jgi:hypothetical protein